MVGGMRSIGGGGGRERRSVFRWGNLKKGGHFEDTGLDRWIIIKRILKDRMRWHSLNSSGSGYEPVADSCENVVHVPVPQNSG
jgi:hypothetical protein